MKNILKQIGQLPFIVAFWISKNWHVLLLVGLGWLAIQRMVDANHGKPSDYFTSFLDPLFSLMGLLLTVGVTLFLARREWGDNLDQRLVVHFVNPNGQFIASCYNINLLPNAEMRSLGQQIAQQMFNNQFVRFNPSVEMLSKGTVWAKSDTKLLGGGWIKYAEIKFNLLDDSYNQKSEYYALWNLGDNQQVKKRVDVANSPFHIYNPQFSLPKLLSTDDASMNDFMDKVGEKALLPKPRLFLTDAYLIMGEGMVELQRIDDPEEISMLLAPSQSSPYSVECHIADRLAVTWLNHLTGMSFTPGAPYFKLDPKLDLCLLITLDTEGLRKGVAYPASRLSQIGFSATLVGPSN